jgi:hypothetical protein
MQRYFDPGTSHGQMRQLAPAALAHSKHFAAEAVRDTLRQKGYRDEQIVRYCYRPFDLRWLYWEPQTNLLDRKREDYLPHVTAGNVFMSAGPCNRKEGFYRPQLTCCLADHHIVESNAGLVPLYLYLGATARPNLGDRARSYLAHLGTSPEDLFYHALAILHAPAYAAENGGGLRQDWPRVPLPSSAEQLRHSAALGRDAAGLLDAAAPVRGVTWGKARAALQSLATLDPAAGLEVRSGWGFCGRGGVTMPGCGSLRERPPAPGELTDPRLGATTCDVYLNSATCFHNVPARVWQYALGGYPVLKKWLSYRDSAVLGRPLRPDEAAEFTRVVRRIAALLLLAGELDRNYRAAASLHDPA